MPALVCFPLNMSCGYGLLIGMVAGKIVSCELLGTHDLKELESLNLRMEYIYPVIMILSMFTNLDGKFSILLTTSDQASSDI